MIEMFPTSQTMAAAAARGVEACLARGLGGRGRASLVGTGGRAPGPVYDALQDARLDWARVVVTLSDERCVPEDAPESNLRLLRSRLLAGPAGKAHALPLWPQPPAAALEALIPFDAVMLGMGEDGHVASLIPGSPSLAEGLDPDGAQLTIITPPGLGSPPVARISLTMKALLQSRAVFLLVAGDAKRHVIARALGGEDLPVRGLLVQDRVPVRILWSPDHERGSHER